MSSEITTNNIISYHPLDPSFKSAYDTFMLQYTKDDMVTLPVSALIATTAEILVCWLWMSDKRKLKLINIDRPINRYLTIKKDEKKMSLTYRSSYIHNCCRVPIPPITDIDVALIQSFIIDLRKTLLVSSEAIISIVTDEYTKSLSLNTEKLLSLSATLTTPLTQLILGKDIPILLQLTPEGIHQLLRDGFRDSIGTATSLTDISISLGMFVLIITHRRIRSLIFLDDKNDCRGLATVEVTVTVYPREYCQTYILPHWQYIIIANKYDNCQSKAFNEYLSSWSVDSVDALLKKFLSLTLEGWLEWHNHLLA